MRTKAVVPLLDLAADPEDAVRAAATAALAKLGPFDADDRAKLEPKLTHADARVRVAAAGLIAPLVTTADDATKTWPPLLKDRDPDVRTFALGQLAKHPESLEQCGEAVVMLLADPSPAFRQTAVNLAPKVKGTPGLESGLDKLAATETDEAIKSAAMVARVALADADELHLPLFRKVLTTGPAPAKRAAADKLAALKAGAAPAVDDLVACVGHADDEVRAAAIRALAAVGKDGVRGRGAIEKAFAADKSDAVLVAAANYLATSEAGLKVLKDARDRTFTPPVLAAVCRAFAANPDKDSLKWLTARAAVVEDCREVVTAALIKQGADEHVVELIDLTYKNTVAKPGQPAQPLSIETRRWALATLAKMDHANITTPATKLRLGDRVKDLSMSIGANEKELAAEAAAFLKTLKP